MRYVFSSFFPLPNVLECLVLTLAGFNRSLSLTPLNPSIFPTNETHSSVRQHKHKHKFSFRLCVRDSFHTVLHPYTKHKQKPSDDQKNVISQNCRPTYHLLLSLLATLDLLSAYVDEREDGVLRGVWGRWASVRDENLRANLRAFLFGVLVWWYFLGLRFAWWFLTSAPSSLFVLLLRDFAEAQRRDDGWRLLGGTWTGL